MVSILKTSFALSQLNLHSRNDILQTLCLRSFSRCSVQIRQGFRTRAAIQAEILALRHQLLVLQRSVRTQDASDCLRQVPVGLALATLA